ncbi:hypothetical protein HO173_012365 [Letharia columbiana]|uniref:Uncharacterized protein n=1 Tax=Letharia columbiana TaxID=112416 RepID=A0A8H6FG74_9LECA|nr:uncharacterized protein HO173_012365 [Letharia columbiana]KAF6226698.1 hypothetical protein HO173_012365 [Letharia columbiana]
MPRQSHRSRLGLHLGKRLPTAIALPEPASIKNLVDKPLSGLSAYFKRDDCSGSNSSSPGCQKPTDSSNVTLPVVLAVVIPIAVAILIFIYLHRKHVKKLRREDANDPHRSLDFGWDPASVARANTKKGKKNKPEMVATDPGAEKALRRERGMSMDVDISSPYLLPPGLGGSRESLHSMSRTMHSQDDRYRPATTYIPGDTTSVHSSRTGRKGADDSSSYAGSGSTRRGPGDDMKKDLLGNAQRMSRSMPPSAGVVPKFPLLDTPRDSYIDKNGADLRKSNNYLGAFIHSRDPSTDVLTRDFASPKSEYATPNEFPSTPSSTIQQIAPSTSLQQPGPSSILQKTSSRKSPPPNVSTEPPTSRSSPPNITEIPSTRSSLSRPPRKQSLRSSTERGHYENFLDDASDYGDGSQVVPPSLRSSQASQHELNRQSSQAYMPPIHEHSLGVEEGHRPGFDPRRSSMGFRPLPPDDPTDNPEQRANRIRSFYKEYFDDSRPGPKRAAGDYYEDYDQQYLGDGAIFDPVSGRAQPLYAAPNDQPRGRPYAEPYGRRAMTPPPRAPPGYGRRHAATMSGSGKTMPPRSRAHSSHSGRFGPSGRGTPQKQIPPPQPLNVLPSPHLLKEDTFLPMDFAPPTTARERQAGRSGSPRGGLRPYSPIVPAHMPLVSSFDDLAPMPSPHLLRNSGTFTALDFAPPPRFRNNETASDSGSIRSNHSGVSARTNQSIRAGAYRVSRIPKEFVGTKEDLNEALKPQWNMHAS